MEAWIVAIVAVLGFLYQVVIGQQSIVQWFRRQERNAEDKQVQEAATVHVNARQALASAIADGIRFVQEHPVQTGVRVVIGMLVTLGSLIVLFLFTGALLWLIGSAFGINATVAFGERLMTTSGEALVNAALTAFSLILLGLMGLAFYVLFSAGSKTDPLGEWWKGYKEERENAKRKAAREAKARARQTVP